MVRRPQGKLWDKEQKNAGEMANQLSSCKILTVREG